MDHIFGSLETMQVLCLILALGLAFAFEFVNGFHDTANAVATVIYTNSLPAWLAVIWSGIWNLIGVLLSAGTVAFGIISLLPVELVMNVGSSAGFAMVFALLISAIIWNLGTWYLGLPASSSHTLIGSIMGVGLMNSLMNSGGWVGGINWAQAQKIGMSLLVSPVVGFACTALLFLVLKALIRQPALFAPPGSIPASSKPVSWLVRFRFLAYALLCGLTFWLSYLPSMLHLTFPADSAMPVVIFIVSGFAYVFLVLAIINLLVLGVNNLPWAKKPAAVAAASKTPPWWIQDTLLFTCTGVSFAHGSNDGQKGMGLVMLILVGIVPGTYALKLDTGAEDLKQLTVMSQKADSLLAKHFTAPMADAAAAGKTLASFIKAGGAFTDAVFPALAEKNQEIATLLAGQSSLDKLTTAQRSQLRLAIYSTAETIGKLNSGKHLGDEESTTLTSYKKALEKTTKYIPPWVKYATALALGLGTMIGWKRIVVTVGEKIGKTHLTYAQGASAEMIAMITIKLADNYGLPVSTTHVLSSGVAGSMAANKSGLQTATLRNLLMAWVLTLPVCVFLGAMFFAGGLYFISSILGMH